MYNENCSGPKTERCGTPCLILDQFEVKAWPLRLTFSFTC
jgi:hypothetical protein